MSGRVLQVCEWEGIAGVCKHAIMHLVQETCTCDRIGRCRQF